VSSIPRATPFTKILIANRGEIALRVMRTAKAMGYATVAVYSTADRYARHVREADEALFIGESAPALSYLSVKAIVAAARMSGADAVHPGYGFLAENAGFARACRDAGLVFVGPSPEAIAAMGDKGTAKRIMREAGVPCVPGYEGEDQNEARLAEEAGRIGFPVMIKAASGGGGRGTRLVASAEGFADALHSARSEAKSAFGDDRVILEKAIVDPRHVEIQAFGDRYGAAIHLGERDCSVQRRHQKLIEEAPSPAVSPELRARMGETAVAAVQAIAYEGAGTLEFLLDRSGAFYFMEMNTRLQVEHPVTEAITGLDLVEMQLRVAAGEPLPILQKDVRFDGHAIEVRLCAESAKDGFIPQSGAIALWHAPVGARVEHALESGAEIPAFYDSMIAKLICHGATREDARRKLVRALDEAVALGAPTNQAFLSRCLKDPVFVEGGATTGFIAERGAELLASDPEDEARACAIAAALLYATANSEGVSPIAHRLPIALRLAVDSEAYEAELTNLGAGRCRVSAGERSFELAIVELKAEFARVDCGGLVESVVFMRSFPELFLHCRGVARRIEDRTHAPAATRREAASDGKIRAAMNGRVVSVEVAVGDRVKAGQPVLTLEAMKMQHVHAAPLSGRVSALHVARDDQVAAHRIVAEIEREEATP
jgi:geranyl-CoA carboxylase alpha subunit